MHKLVDFFLSFSLYVALTCHNLNRCPENSSQQRTRKIFFLFFVEVYIYLWKEQTKRRALSHIKRHTGRENSSAKTKSAANNNQNNNNNNKRKMFLKWINSFIYVFAVILPMIGFRRFCFFFVVFNFLSFSRRIHNLPIGAVATNSDQRDSIVRAYIFFYFS